MFPVFYYSRQWTLNKKYVEVQLKRWITYFEKHTKFSLEIQQQVMDWGFETQDWTDDQLLWFFLHITFLFFVPADVLSGTVWFSPISTLLVLNVAFCSQLVLLPLFRMTSWFLFFTLIARWTGRFTFILVLSDWWQTVSTCCSTMSVIGDSTVKIYADRKFNYTNM